MTNEEAIQASLRLGLPRRERFPRWLKLGLFAAGAAAVLLAVGIAGGCFAAMRLHLSQEKLLRQIEEAVMPEDARAALESLESSVADTPSARLLLAAAYDAAARRLPERNSLLQKCRREIENVLARGDFSRSPLTASAAEGAAKNGTAVLTMLAGKFSPEQKIRMQMFLAGTLLEIGADKAALSTLQTVDEKNFPDQETRRAYVNLRAYLHAAAADSRVRNPAAALRYAAEAVADWRTCKEAALLDTAAMAQAANGQWVLAREIQRRAWGLADPKDLWSYQDNYGKIERGARASDIKPLKLEK